MPEILETRRAIRTEKLKQREALSTESRQAASDVITNSVIQLVRTSNWRVVHSYLAFRSEVLTTAIIEKLLSLNVIVIVPWVEDNGELSHHQLLGLDSLGEGPYGLPHPARNEYHHLDRIDAVLLPLAAFDRSGNRLGYGKGFYDRFLAALPSSTKRIGLAFATQEAEAIPTMEHDQKLDMIITEREIITTA
jgi:5-formyltetrahydrofolate cyclo-ligase